MSIQENLSSEQVELLYDAERIRDDGNEPVVVCESAVEAVHDALGKPLESLGIRPEAIENMNLESLAAQYATDEDDETGVDLLARNQTPETGGTDGTERE